MTRKRTDTANLRAFVVEAYLHVMSLRSTDFIEKVIRDESFLTHGAMTFLCLLQRSFGEKRVRFTIPIEVKPSPENVGGSELIAQVEGHN